MYRKIQISDHEYRSVSVTFTNNIEYWNCEECAQDTVRIAEWLRKQGAVLFGVIATTREHCVEVARSFRKFKDETYFLHQCDGDLAEWFNNSPVNSFTYYFDKVIFNTHGGFVAAYRDDIENNWNI